MSPLTTVSMSDVHQNVMREWARDNGKSVRQRTVRQETTKYKLGTLPLNMYQSEEQIGEKVSLMTLANIAVKVVLAILMLILMKNCRKPELVVFENHSVRTKHLSIRSMACKTCDE